ncbi:hypothetical protein TKK_0015632 [Trichogramma kaykai]
MIILENAESGVPECDGLDHSSLNKKLRHRQKILFDLRARFRSEYFGQLIEKKGSKQERRQIKIGDIVLIGDDIHRRIDWPLGRVIEAFPGADGTSRVFMVKTKQGVLKRPIQRLYPLEVPTEPTGLSSRLHNESKQAVIESSKEHTIKIQNKNLIELEPENQDVKSDDSSVHDLEQNIPICVTSSGRRIKRPQRLHL